MDFELFMGCDLSQDTFNYCLRNKSSIIVEASVENSPKAIRTWLKELSKTHKLSLHQILFCMEHTGVYGLHLLRALHDQSLVACLESGMNIKFSLGLQRGKNDKIDARRIADYAMRNVDRLKQWKPKRPVLEQLQLLIRLRERLVNAKKDLSRYNLDAKRFLGPLENQLLIEGSKESLNSLSNDIDRVDKKMEELIQSDENLKRLSRLIRSVDGIGPVTSNMILVKTNEFEGIKEGKKFACTAGIAPFEHSSGTSVRKKMRVSHSAHKDMKALMHMCAISVIGRKGFLQDYYLKKVAEGKNKMSVINAVRNKLVHRIFAVVRDETMYDKDYQYKFAVS
jgi:transposase